MTKKATTANVLPPAVQVLTNEQMLVLREGLRKTLKARREEHAPRLTQFALSQQLGYPYSVVTGWENGTRLFYRSNVVAWATALGCDEIETTALLTEYGAGILPDEKAGISTGSRIETALNERVKALRKERRFSIREMAEVTGISAGHWQRIEMNQSNLSVAQVRQLARKLRVSYTWLIDGQGEPSCETMQQTIDRLTRDNELLESFRQQVEQKQAMQPKR